MFIRGHRLLRASVIGAAALLWFGATARSQDQTPQIQPVPASPVQQAPAPAPPPATPAPAPPAPAPAASSPAPRGGAGIQLPQVTVTAPHLKPRAVATAPPPSPAEQLNAKNSGF